MPKKLALFILGLMLAIGAFLLYQYFSGARTGGIAVVKAPATATVTALPAAIEERDPTGQLVYLIRAAKAPEPILDDDKKPLPGQYKMDMPEATFYKVGGRIVHVTADTCRIIFDQPLRGSMPSGGGKVRDQVNLRSGELIGHVRLYISGQNNNAAGPATDGTVPAVTAALGGALGKDPFPNGARIYFDGPVTYDRVQQQISAAEGVHIRSDTASFDGAGFKLAFNQQAQRIDFLRIEKGKEIIMRGMGDRTFDISRTSPATAPVVRANAAAVVTTPKPGKLPPTAYSLAIMDNVQATAGDRSIEADRLNIMFTASEDSKGSGPAATIPATAPVSVDAPVLPDMPADPEPSIVATPKDLHILWTGAMELRPVDAAEVKLANAQDILLEALSTTQRPVTVHVGDRSAQAGRLWYHGDENRVELEPGPFAGVTLTDALKGVVNCPAVTLFLQKNAIFKGPGSIVTHATNADPRNVTSVAWKNQMDVELAWLPDPNNKDNKIVAPRRAIFDGAQVKTSKFDAARKIDQASEFSADSLDVLIANVPVAGFKADGKTPEIKLAQGSEHILAKGHVLVNTRDGAKREQNGLQAADSMEIISTPGDKGPVLSQMLALGDVSVWRTQDKSKPAEPGAIPVAAVAGPLLPDLEKQTINTARLLADFKPKQKSATQPAAGPGDSDALDVSFDVSHFLATNGVKIEITPPPSTKRPSITAIADALDADPTEKDNKQNFRATLSAANTANAPAVRVATGKDYLESRTVMIDSATMTINVPTPGVFDFQLPPKKPATQPAGAKTASTKPAAAPMPMRVTWQKSMIYDGTKTVAVFTGSPVALVPGERADLGKLTASDTLTVQMKAKPQDSKAATQPAAANPLDQENLDLDWMEAVGNVQASGAQLGDGDKTIRDFQFSAIDAPGKPGRLHYVQETQVFDIPGPGALVMKVDQPAKPTKPGDRSDEQTNVNGQSVFGWKENLHYDGVAGLVTFKKDVDYIFTPRDGFKFTKSADVTAALGKPRAAATAKGPDSAHLHTELLTAKFAPTSGGKSVPSPLGLGADGNQNLSSVQAANGAVLEVGGYVIGGDALVFDVPAHTALITPANGDRVVVEQPSTGNRFTGTRVKLDMTQDKKFFEVLGLQGNLVGFGG